MSRQTHQILLLSSIVLSAIVMGQLVNFDTNFVELDDSKMIQTMSSNYAICSPNLPSNWKHVSVNGNEVTIATKDNRSLIKTLSQLSSVERSGLDATRNTLLPVIRVGPFNVKSQKGLSKLTTFDRNGGSSTMGTGGGSSSSSSSSSSSGGNSISISRTGPSSFIVSKQDFPFNWHRVFVNDDAVTIVYKSGRVVMLPQSLLKPDERAQIVELRAEVDRSSKMTESMTNSLSKSLSNPMDFVNRAFGGMFGR